MRGGKSDYEVCSTAHYVPCLTLYVNMMNDKYELAEMRGNPEFYSGWSVHCDGVRASQ